MGPIIVVRVQCRSVHIVVLYVARRVMTVLVGPALITHDTGIQGSVFRISSGVSGV